MPPERQLLLRRFLDENGARFDPAWNLVKVAWQGPGYHTRVPNGTPAHPTVTGLGYALALLEAGDAASVSRAEAILGKVISLQDTDPASKTYGIWPWLAEEPLAEMNPPDWNWADFCGIRLGHSLGAYGSRLGAAMRRDAGEALRAAAWSIFRRNVGPEYTNIAVKGAVVAGLAGELLGDATLLAYARSRLERFVAYTRRTGGFTEYNSPPYGILVLTEAERGLLLLRDPAVTSLLREIHGLCWEMLAGNFHRPTGQLGGPQARAYQDLLTPEAVRTLEEGLGFPLFLPAGPEGARPNIVPAEHLFLIPRLPCPEAARAALFAGGERFVRREYVRHDDPRRQRRAASWMGDEASLGSIQLDTLWTQRRPVLGYWRAGEEVAVLRVRLLRDGRDFASGVVRAAQDGRELLAAVTLSDNKGDFHDTLDRPADGRFRADDLRLSIEVDGPGASAHFNGTTGVLACGGWRAVVSPLLARWENLPVVWEARQEGRKALFQARVVHDGVREFDPRQLSAAIFAFHLALRKEGEEGAFTAAVQMTGGEAVLESDTGLTLSAPLRPCEFP